MASVNYREDGTTPIAVVTHAGEKFQAIALYGTQDSGQLHQIPVTAEGHMEVAIHGPRLPFGEVSVESLSPIFQCDAVYGVNPLLVRATTGGGGSATAATWATNDQVVWTGSVAESGQFSQGFVDELDIQPGETLTLCCKTTGGAAGAIVGSINTREDQ